VLRLAAASHSSLASSLPEAPEPFVDLP
jgi:hypothetical protein